MTETEIVAQTIAPEVFDCPKINLNKPAYDRAYERAQAAIAALDRHRIEGAGELEVRIRARARLTDLQANQDAFLEAAATIATLRAEIERAKLDGVRMGIEAAIECVEMGAAFGCVIAEAPAAVRDLLNHAEAITKGEG